MDGWMHKLIHQCIVTEAPFLMILTKLNHCTTGACHHAEPTQTSTQGGVCFIHVIVGALRASEQCAQGQEKENHD